MSGVQGKRFWIPDWVADHSLAALSGSEVKILVVMSRHADKNGFARPGVPGIAKRTGLTERTVQRGLRSLCKTGLLASVSAKSGGRVARGFYSTNIYRLFVQTWLDLSNPVTRDTPNAGLTPSPVSPLAESKGDKPGRYGCQTESLGVTPVSPEGIKEGIREGRGVSNSIKKMVSLVLGKKPTPKPDPQTEARRQIKALQKGKEQGRFDRRIER